MATVTQSILAKVLIQVGADAPKEIGTIEIPIQIGVQEKPAPPVVSINCQPGLEPAKLRDESNFANAVRGGCV